MKSKNIIYGVSGMLEYQALIKVGGAKMKIPFTNGSSNEAGRTPATFSTSNAMVQMAIENSVEFKSGLIHRVHTVETGEEVYIESDHVALQDNAVVGERLAQSANVEDHPNPAPFTVVTGDAGNNATQEEPTGTTAAPDESGQVQPVSDDIPAQADEETIETATRKEFSCNDDAKDFFETEFGVKRSTLHTRADIIAYGKGNGIDVVFAD